MMITRKTRAIRWVGLIAILLEMVLPAMAFALSISPTTYTIPPNATVSWTGLGPTSGCDLYSSSNGNASPVASQEAVACGDTGTLNTLGWASGSFNGSVVGSYTFVGPNAVGCAGSSLATCQANNPTMPQATFTISQSSLRKIKAIGVNH